MLTFLSLWLDWHAPSLIDFYGILRATCSQHTIYVRYDSTWASHVDVIPTAGESWMLFTSHKRVKEWKMAVFRMKAAAAIWFELLVARSDSWRPRWHICGSFSHAFSRCLVLYSPTDLTNWLSILIMAKKGPRDPVSSVREAKSFVAAIDRENPRENLIFLNAFCIDRTPLSATLVLICITRMLCVKCLRLRILACPLGKTKRLQSWFYCGFHAYVAYALFTDNWASLPLPCTPNVSVLTFITSMGIHY
jgi:hypothetical protein